MQKSLINGHTGNLLNPKRRAIQIQETEIKFNKTIYLKFTVVSRMVEKLELTNVPCLTMGTVLWVGVINAMKFCNIMVQKSCNKNLET